MFDDQDEGKQRAFDDSDKMRKELGPEWSGVVHYEPDLRRWVWHVERGQVRIWTAAGQGSQAEFKVRAAFRLEMFADGDTAHEALRSLVGKANKKAAELIEGVKGI